MALAGMLRLEGVPNFLPETTGARAAAVGGVVFQPASVIAKEVLLDDESRKAP